LPRHHLESLSELLAGTVTSSSIDSKEDDGGWAGADFSGLNDLEALHRFLDSSNYLLKGFDSNDKNHDQSRECFMCNGEPPTRMRENTPRLLP
jgi:hypothetical protein